MLFEERLQFLLGQLFEPIETERDQIIGCVDGLDGRTRSEPADPSQGKAILGPKQLELQGLWLFGQQRGPMATTPGQGEMHDLFIGPLEFSLGREFGQQLV